MLRWPFFSEVDTDLCRVEDEGKAVICLVMAGQDVTFARTCLMGICFTVFVSNTCETSKNNTRRATLHGRTLKEEQILQS